MKHLDMSEKKAFFFERLLTSSCVHHRTDGTDRLWKLGILSKDAKVASYDAARNPIYSHQKASRLSEAKKQGNLHLHNDTIKHLAMHEESDNPALCMRKTFL